MYFEPWMIAVMIAAYGICAWRSYKTGHYNGIQKAVINVLVEMIEGKAIHIADDGKIMPYRLNRTEEHKHEGFYHK
jgi:hypothetical protein